jgi:hypothetical protein
MVFSNTHISIYICVTSQYLISLRSKAQLFFSLWPTHLKGKSITFCVTEKHRIPEHPRRSVSLVPLCDFCFRNLIIESYIGCGILELSQLKHS